jgi:hypothetical protein
MHGKVKYCLEIFGKKNRAPALELSMTFRVRRPPDNVRGCRTGRASATDYALVELNYPK